MNTINNKLYYRLIALWAVCEGVLGGILHGFQLPVTGLIVGGAAVIIICMIGYYVPGKGNILKATVAVAIFKMMMSPFSPLPAYVAVFFQGCTGQLFFNNRKWYKLSCVIFATLALFESAVQKIFTATLIYGVAFWKAVNDFINGLTHQEHVTNYSLIIAIAFVLLHIAAGFFIGRLASGVPENISKWKENIHLNAPEPIPSEINVPVSRKKKKLLIKRSFIIVWLVLLCLYVQSVNHIGKPLIVPGIILGIILRSALIIFTWYILLSPLLTKILKKWLEKQKRNTKYAIPEIFELIPATRVMVENSWKQTGDKKRWRRLKRFIKIVLVHSLAPAEVNPEA